MKTTAILVITLFALTYASRYSNFISHNSPHITLEMRAMDDTISLSDCSLGAKISITSDGYGRIGASSKYPRAVAACMSLTRERRLNLESFEYLGLRRKANSMCDYVIVLLPRSKKDIIVEDWLTAKGFFNDSRSTLEDWLSKLTRNEHFAVVTFAFSKQLDFSSRGEAVIQYRSGAESSVQTDSPELSELDLIDTESETVHLRPRSRL